MINVLMKPVDVYLDAVLTSSDTRHRLLNVTISKQLTITRTAIRHLYYKYLQQRLLRSF